MADDSNKIELNRRRVLGGIVTVGAAAAAAGAGTFAAFSDTEDSTNNTIQAGTLDLQGTTSGDFPFTNITPGWTASPSITTTYDSGSSVDPAELDLALSLSENDASSDPTAGLTATEFAQKIWVVSATVEDEDGNSTDLTADLTARETNHPNSQSYIDLAQLADGSSYDAVLGGLNAGETATLSLSLEMPMEVGNAAQADGISLTASFTAEQPGAD